MTNPTPIYTSNQADPAYCLRFSWTGFPSGRFFTGLPSPELLHEIAPLWEEDGIRLLENYWSDEKIQLTFSTKPAVSPVVIAQRAKGRVQYALRKANTPQKFSKKLSIRSVGNNTTKDVTEYIRSQVENETYIDPKFAQKMRQMTVIDPTVDLSIPSRSAHGRYWYNLHVVLVTAERHNVFDIDALELTRDGCFRIANRKLYRLSGVSVMPDHLHLALRGDYNKSPEEIALEFKNNLAFLHGQQAIWNSGFYVGTFGEYNMQAIRNNASPQLTVVGSSRVDRRRAV